ncbi:unnamed protein product [Paramecium octaurelia]|uniref:Uncharacterized protein n=1 Tax=Paramecium octaurelia TaxID=43137 RepID=A0A8S1WEZ2_PAROT|nr:unnamed protein product [Paramecium octaurelia]
MVSASLVQDLGIIQIHLLFLQQHNVIDITCITVKGLEAVKTCKEIYLESYISILGIDRLKLQEFYGREVIEADREC